MRWAVGIFFMLHGLGHTMGFLAAWTHVDVGFDDTPWILTGDVRIRSPIGWAFGMLWLVAMAGWVVAGWGVIDGAEWWPALAKGAAVVSLAAIVPWWNTVPTGARLGVLADVVILAGLLSTWGRDIADRLA